MELYCCHRVSTHLQLNMYIYIYIIEGRGGMIGTIVLRTLEGNKITRPIQLVIQLEFDQGGEDVEDLLSS